MELESALVWELTCMEVMWRLGYGAGVGGCFFRGWDEVVGEEGRRG